jgi:hypothetical protein
MLGTGALLLNGRHIVGELPQCLSFIPRLHNFPFAMEQVPGYRVLGSHAPLHQSPHPLLRRIPPGTEIFNLNSTFARRSAIGKSRCRRSRECIATVLASTTANRYKALSILFHPSAESLSRPAWLRASNLISHMRPQSTSHLHARTYIWPACTYIRGCLMYSARGAKRLCVRITHSRLACTECPPSSL